MGMPNVTFLVPPIFSNPSFTMGSSSTPLQGFPWGGGHIPPSNPSIGSGTFPSSRLSLGIILSQDGVVKWVEVFNILSCQ
jgi:hypothetical protein